MATKIEALPKARRASARVIPSEWLDGDAWQIDINEESFASITAARTACRRAAEAANGHIKSAVVSETVLAIEFRNGPAPQRNSKSKPVAKPAAKRTRKTA